MRPYERTAAAPRRHDRRSTFGDRSDPRYGSGMPKNAAPARQKSAPARCQ